jgi:putative Mn2+ efflux pump MntP
MKEAVPSKQNIKLFCALPLVFSLDNLAVGLGTDKGAAIWPWIALVGATSGLMSFLGFRLGSSIRGHLPSRAVGAICAGLLCFVALMAL